MMTTGKEGSGFAAARFTDEPSDLARPGAVASAGQTVLDMTVEMAAVKAAGDVPLPSCAATTGDAYAAGAEMERITL